MQLERGVGALALAALLAVCPLVACGQESAVHDPLILGADDPLAVRLEEARDQAFNSLPVFWERFNARQPGLDNFSVKVRLPTSDGLGLESVWLLVEGFAADGSIVGLLASDPVALGSLRLGSRIEVTEDYVSDWTYRRDGKQFGHFVTRVMLERATPAQRAEIIATLAPTPLEPR